VVAVDLTPAMVQRTDNRPVGDRPDSSPQFRSEQLVCPAEIPVHGRVYTTDRTSNLLPSWAHHPRLLFSQYSPDILLITLSVSVTLFLAGSRCVSAVSSERNTNSSQVW